MQSLEVFSPDSKPYGLTYGEWTVRWWRWLMSIPMHENPAADETGLHVGKHQPYDNVWFLAGTFGGKSASRSCTIPTRSILFPVINIEVNEVEMPKLVTDSQRIEYVTEDENNIISLNAQLDGNKVPVYRVRSDPVVFPLSIMEDNPFNVSHAANTMAAADGYWVFFKSLPPGNHKLSFAASCSAGTRNVNAQYDLRVE